MAGRHETEISRTPARADKAAGFMGDLLQAAGSVGGCAGLGVGVGGGSMRCGALA